MVETNQNFYFQCGIWCYKSHQSQFFIGVRNLYDGIVKFKVLCIKNIFTLLKNVGSLSKYHWIIYNHKYAIQVWQSWGRGGRGRERRKIERRERMRMRVRVRKRVRDRDRVREGCKQRVCVRVRVRVQERDRYRKREGGRGRG